MAYWMNPVDVNPASMIPSLNHTHSNLWRKRMASRNLIDLDPRLRPLAEEFLARCCDAGEAVLITCTYRSNAEQDKLYAQGRTTPGKIVTNAKAGQSKHNVIDSQRRPASLAFDVVLMRGGKCIWDVKDPGWQTIGAIGEAVGLEWAGRWKRMREFPHFQLKP
jgi:peptidoglycan L-alanyl-D-glutamate endopeptidase CwlK